MRFLKNGSVSRARDDSKVAVLGNYARGPHWQIVPPNDYEQLVAMHCTA